MSKKMGLGLMTALLPTTVHAGQQLMKMGGGGGRGFFSSLEQVGKAWGGLGGFKNYWRGGAMEIKNGVLGWGGATNSAEQIAVGSVRRATAGYLGAMGAMNLMVGDNGLAGSIKSGVNIGSALALGMGTAPGIWNFANSRQTSLGRRGIKGSAMGAAGLWAANKIGVI